MTGTILEHVKLRRGDHLVHFYESSDDLAGTVGRYLADGLFDGAGAVVIASEPHIAAFQRELRAVGEDLDGVVAEARLAFLDARTTLDKLLVDGRINASAFDREVAGPLRDAAGQWTSIRAYGEMVDLLWQVGDLTSAIELEHLWNGLIEELGLSLLCAYSAASFAAPEHEQALRAVCQQHSSISPRMEGSPDRPREARRGFQPDAGAPRAARRFLEETLGQWGLDGAVLQDALLLASELVTNAVVHARSRLAMVIREQESSLRLAVHDEHPAAPVPGPGIAEVVGGHGLRLVAMLGEDWGVDRTATGKAVWVELAAAGTT